MQVASNGTPKNVGRALWIAQVLLALVFVFAGGMKLALPLAALKGPVPLPGLFLRFIGYLRGHGRHWTDRTKPSSHTAWPHSARSRRAGDHHDQRDDAHDRRRCARPRARPGDHWNNCGKCGLRTLARRSAAAPRVIRAAISAPSGSLYDQVLRDLTAAVRRWRGNVQIFPHNALEVSLWRRGAGRGQGNDAVHVA